MSAGQASPEARGARVLVVDDERGFLAVLLEALRLHGLDCHGAADGKEALEALRQGGFDAIVSDIAMPGMSGIAFLREVRARDLDVPVILMTGSPEISSAVAAVELGALKYLLKPFPLERLIQAVEHAVRLGRLARLKREALAAVGGGGQGPADRAGHEVAFARALASIRMAWQPIVDWPGRRIHAWEALVRTAEPTFPHPGALFGAAQLLDRLHDLGRAIRAAVARDLLRADGGDRTAFVNLHSRDLFDEELYRRSDPLAPHASRVVLEVTERAPLGEARDVRERVDALRRMGYRIAVDDLGAGYAGLASFAVLEPEVVKLDMVLVRGVDRAPLRRSIVEHMVSICAEMGKLVVVEGVETAGERAALEAAGCRFMQGFLFARPSEPFPDAAF